MAVWLPFSASFCQCDTLGGLVFAIELCPHWVGLESQNGGAELGESARWHLLHISRPERSGRLR